MTNIWYSCCQGLQQREEEELEQQQEEQQLGQKQQQRRRQQQQQQVSSPSSSSSTVLPATTVAVTSDAADAESSATSATTITNYDDIDRNEVVITGSGGSSNSSKAVVSKKQHKKENKSSSRSSRSNSPTCSISKSVHPAKFTNYTSASVINNISELFNVVLDDYQPRPPLSVSLLPKSLSSSNANTTSAVPPENTSSVLITCQINHIGDWLHFPHTMQQILRCWSLFQLYPDNQKVLITSINTVSKRQQYNFTSSFNEGVLNTLQMMEEGIQVVNWDTLKEQTFDVIAIGNSSSTIVSFGVKHREGRHLDVYDGYKTLSTKHIELFRTKVLQTLNITDHGYCGIGSSLDDGHPQQQQHRRRRFPRIGILNRQNTRVLLNAQEIVSAINTHRNDNQNHQDESVGPLQPQPPKLFYMEGKTFPEQVAAMSNIDLLITPHGAGITSTIFLPKCAVFLEVEPMGHNFGKFYGSLASISNHNHATLYAGGRYKGREIKQGLKDRGAVRKRDVCPNITLVLDALDQMEIRWNQCCTNTQKQKARRGGA